MAVATARQSKLDEIAQSILAIETQARTDFLWAAAHLLMIKDKDAALVPLRLNFPQVYLYKKYLLPAWQRGEPLALLCLKARREGISTFFQGWFFHKLRWIPGQNILVAAHRDDTVDELHQMVQRFHQNLPPEMRPPTKRQSRKELAYLPPLDGNMRVLPAVHMDIARGKTIQHCLLSEAAFYPDLELILAGIAEAVPDRGRSSIVIETTAEGASGGFYEMWENLGKKREIFAGARNWRRAFLPWFIHPDHELSVPRGWEPTTEELEMQKRFNLRLGQLVWYRMKLQEMELKHPGRGKRKMRSEYPSTAIEAFQMAGEGIFPEDAMTAQEAYTRPPKIGFDLVRIDAWRFGLKPQHPGQAQFQIWELPQGQAQYTIGVDVATGIGRDESAVVVIRMPGFVQVAQWHDNHTPSSDVAGIVAAIAKFYAQCGNQPIVNTEITGYGLDVVSRLSDFYAHEPFIQYIWESFDRLAAKPVGPASRLGWLTTHISKQIMVSAANSLLTAGFCEIPSREILADMRLTQEVSMGTYATSGNDLCMAWLLAVIAAWRKIARFEFGEWGMGQKKPEEEKPEWRDPSTYDTKADEILHGPALVGAAAGALDVDFMAQ